MLRRKAAAALNALEPHKMSPAKEPLFATLQRRSEIGHSISAPGLGVYPSRKARSSASPLLYDQISFGQRPPLPPSLARSSSIEYYAMGRAPPTFIAMTQPPLSHSSTVPSLGFRPPRTAPPGAPPPPLTRGVSHAPGMMDPALGSRSWISTAHPPGCSHAGPLDPLDMAGDMTLGAMGVSGGGALGRRGSQVAATPSGVGRGGSSGKEFVGLSDEIDELADRLAQVERLTSMLNPEYTHTLQRKLKASFHHIDGQMGTIDQTLLTEQQKRAHAAATSIQARIRAFICRQRYTHARTAMLSWRSRELSGVGARIVAWLRRREQIEEVIEAKRDRWRCDHLHRIVSAWRYLAKKGLPARQTLDTELRARRHYRYALTRRVLWGWKRVTHHANLCEVRWVMRGNRRVALRKEVVQTVEAFLRAWHDFVRLSVETRRRFGDLGIKALAKAFYAFQGLVARRKRLRNLTITRWKDYCKASVHLPFRAWYLFLIDQKLLRRVRTMLIGSFRRKLVRRLLGTIVAGWHELTKRGTFDSRSKSQLRESLTVQEGLTAAAEDALEEYSKVLLDAERSLDAESRTQSLLARRTQSAHTELAALRVKCHSAQQEVLRLRTLVRHYEIRYPRAFASPMLEGHAAAVLPAVAEEEVVPAPNGDGDAEPPHEAASPALALPAVPLIVQTDDMHRLARLGLAVHPLLATDKYAPPASGGTMADFEVRRLRELLSFVVSGELPANPSLEVLDLQQASELQYEYREADAAAAIYTADGASLRTLDTPQHMAAAGVVELGSTLRESPKESPQSADHGAGSALVGQMVFDDSFDDSTAEEPPPPPPPEGGAELLARRVAERREELRTRVAMQRVNLYAPEVHAEVVSAHKEVNKEAAAAAAAAGGEFAQALVGF